MRSSPRSPRFSLTLFLSLLTLLGASPVQAGSFRQLVGSVKVQPVQAGKTLTVPFITWGGDMVTFYANGGLKTKKGSLFDKQGLSMNLVPGDNFPKQVKDYLSGRSPLLRGTFRMIGMASEVIGSDPRTKGVMLMQMTWSAGDHMVTRPAIKTVSDLKGKTVVLQQGGPHVGMLADVLASARLSWSDVKVVWAKELTGPGGPAEIFRKNPKVAACFVISPDMIGLSGGLRTTGSGAEGTVKGARVLVSTAELSRSIADVYICRKDYFDTHKEQMARFVAAYMKASEEVLDLKKSYEASGSQKYMKLLEMSQKIYGTEVLPTLDEDAHGLLSDCTLVGYPGNVSFFEKKGNLHGFEAMEKSALDLATNQGYASVRAGFFPAKFDYRTKPFIGYLTKTKLEKKEQFRAEAVLSEIEALSSGELDDRTILSFTINFEPNQTEFSASRYGVEFQRVVELADKYGNAVIAVRGHSDPTKTLVELVRAGLKRGVLKKQGRGRSARYSLRGRTLSLENTGNLVRMIEAGAFDGVAEHNPRKVMQAALNLSRKRAASVRKAVVRYAKSKGIDMDTSQIQPVGVGIREPFVAQPRSMDDARQNMRVEFLLMRVEAEVVSTSDFDY
jgi:outer membrane protein OmpA-like peptidoglycan-associated protein